MSFFCLQLVSGKAKLTALCDDIDTAKAHCRLIGGDSWAATKHGRTQKLITVFALTGKAPAGITLTGEQWEEFLGITPTQNQRQHRKSEQKSEQAPKSAPKGRRPKGRQTKSNPEGQHGQTSSLFEPRKSHRQKEREQESHSSQQAPKSFEDSTTLEY